MKEAIRSMIGDDRMTWFALIRHANTEWNREKRIQGQHDSPLTDKGVSQARKWGDILKKYPWDRIISSDLGRAVHTATLINESLNVSITHDANMREQDWGEWSGKTPTQLKTDDPERFSRQIDAGWAFRPPGGESRHQVWKRAQYALLSIAEKRPGERILLVIHEGVIKCLVYRLCNRQFLPTEPALLRPRRLHWLIGDGDGFRVEKINALVLL